MITLLERYGNKCMRSEHQVLVRPSLGDAIRRQRDVVVYALDYSRRYVVFGHVIKSSFCIKLRSFIFITIIICSFFIYLTFLFYFFINFCVAFVLMWVYYTIMLSLLLQVFTIIFHMIHFFSCSVTSSSMCLGNLTLNFIINR